MPSSFESRLRQQLSGFSPRKITPDGKGEASVLFSVFEEDGLPWLLLTRRSERLSAYRGHISFPGGMREPFDAGPVDTAVRETNEELGIEREKIRIIGEFHDYLSNEGVVVHSIIGMLLSTSHLRLQPEEVDYLLEVPLFFFKENRPRVERWKKDGTEFDVYFYDFQGEVIWGLTARMIRNFVDQFI